LNLSKSNGDYFVIIQGVVGEGRSGKRQ